MKTTLLIILLSGAFVGATTTQSITVGITDSTCDASHSMMKGHADDDCVNMCLKGSADYALYNGKTVCKLSAQKTPASFIAKRVKVTGTVDEKIMKIKVTKSNLPNSCASASGTKLMLKVNAVGGGYEGEINAQGEAEERWHVHRLAQNG